MTTIAPAATSTASAIRAAIARVESARKAPFADHAEAKAWIAANLWAQDLAQAPLLKMPGVGLSTVKLLAQWVAGPAPEGDTDGDDRLADEDRSANEAAAVEIARHLRELASSPLMERDLLDGFATLLNRMATRRRTRIAKLAEKLDATPDLPDEITGLQRQELEDQIAQLGEEAAACEHAVAGAAAAYNEATGETWCPASATATTFHRGVLGLATEIALGNVAPATPEADAYRLVVTGDANSTDPILVRSYLDKVAQKHGAHRLWIYCGDAPKGVDATVTAWAREHRVTIRQYGLQHDRHGKRAGFVRNKTIVAQAEPHAVLVFGGGGVQADLVDVALKAEVKHVLTPVAPLGWSVGDDLRPVRSSRQAAPSSAA